MFDNLIIDKFEEFEPFDFVPTHSDDSDDDVIVIRYYLK